MSFVIRCRPKSDECEHLSRLNEPGPAVRARVGRTGSPRATLDDRLNPERQTVITVSVPGRGPGAA